MKEIGGYFELDTYTGEMLHGDGVKLNSARNALAYVIKAKRIKKLYMPFYFCDACDSIVKKYGVEVIRYHIGLDFKPLLNKRDGWLYIVNYFGQLNNEYLLSLGDNIIIDNAQAYFQEPINSFDTIYTCRKFFGVPDGAVLYTNQHLEVRERGESHNNMLHILGRLERTASEFYCDYLHNEESFFDEPIKIMSRLTDNLLHGLDYSFIKKRRTDNYMYLHKCFSSINRLTLSVPEGAFAYPLFIHDGCSIRKELIKNKVYVPILWPSVLSICNENDLEFDMANNILPIPVDQRYDIRDMQYIADIIKGLASK